MPTKWIVALVLVPLVLGLAVGLIAWQLSGDYPRDDTLKWTVIAAVFTGGAALKRPLPSSSSG